MTSAEIYMALYSKTLPVMLEHYIALHGGPKLALPSDDLLEDGRPLVLTPRIAGVTAAVFSSQFIEAYVDLAIQRVNTFTKDNL